MFAGKSYSGLEFTRYVCFRLRRNPEEWLGPYCVGIGGATSPHRSSISPAQVVEHVICGAVGAINGITIEKPNASTINHLRVYWKLDGQYHGQRIARYFLAALARAYRRRPAFVTATARATSGAGTLYSAIQCPASLASS